MAFDPTTDSVRTVNRASSRVVLALAGFAVALAMVRLGAARFDARR